MVSARVGLSLSEFDDLTPAECYTLLKEHSKYRFEEYKKEAELQRVFTMILVNTQIKKGRQYKKPHQFLPFSWENAIDDEMEEELLNTDWDELDKKYCNKK